MSPKTLVTTAEGDVKAFGDWFSKTAAAHPKAVGFLVFIAGALVGHLL